MYMDVHVPRVISIRLRQAGVDVLTAQEDNTATLSDLALLNRAGVLGRVLVTFDADFLSEAHRRQQGSEAFTGVIFVNAPYTSIGRILSDLLLLVQVGEAADFANRVHYLPL